jgi:hypothetical protein
MRRSVASALFIVPVVLLMATTRADAITLTDEDGDNREVLACFHPEGANFVREQGEWDCQASNDDDLEQDLECFQRVFSGQAVYSGTIFYRGKLTNNPYHMNYEARLRIRTEGKRKILEIKITPGDDSAFIPPNSECQLRWWTPVRTR